MRAFTKLFSKRWDHIPFTVVSAPRYWGAPRSSSVQHNVPKALIDRRCKTTTSGDNKTGHIEAGQNEGIFFLDSVFPLRLHLLTGLPFINPEKFLMRLMPSLQNPDIAAAGPDKVAERAIHTSLPINLNEVIPRAGEGGAFVKFAFEPGQDVEEIEQTVKQYLKENPIKPWFNPIRQVKAFLVKGRPWLEDLHRIPNNRVKVEFLPPFPGREAAELSQETLYSLFRRYGKLADIKSQPTDSKELPKFASLKFNTVRHAIRAKNCMHGFVVSSREGGGHMGTMLKLSYEQKRRAHYLWDWLVNHPRLVVPVLIAFFGTVTGMLFDP